MSLLVRGVALVMALTALVWPGFGLIDLSDTWSASGQPVLAGGWGLFFTVLVAVPFLVVVARPSRAAASIWTLWIACASLLLAALWSLEPHLLVLLLWLTLGTAAVAFPSVVERWHPLRLRLQVVPLAVISVTSAPWLAYAWLMAANNRQNRIDTDFTTNVDHYSLQAAMGLTVLLLAILSACWPSGRRQIGAYIGVTAGYFGALSYRWVDYPGGVPEAWALAIICWALGIASWAWWSTSRLRDTGPATIRVDGAGRA
jgi:hypothetical protein